MPLARTIALVAVLLYLLLLAVIVTGALAGGLRAAGPPARSFPTGTQTACAADSTPSALDGGEGGADSPGRPGGSGSGLRP